MIPIFRGWMDRYFYNEEAVLLVVLLLLFFALVWTMGVELGPVFVAVVIAFLMQGMVVWLKQKSLPHLYSVTLAFLLVLSCTIAFMVFLIPIVWQQTRRLFNELPAMVTQGRDLLLLLPEKYPAYVSEEQVNELIGHISNQLTNFGQNILSYSIESLPILFIVALYFILVPLLVFFFLKDSQSILSSLGTLLPRERPVMNKIWHEMNLQIANYVRGKFVEMLLVGAVASVSFVILDLRYALLLGLLVGASVLVPYIGAVVVTFPVMIIGFFQWGFSYDLAVLGVVYLVIQGVDGNVLVPLLFSEAVKLHPAAIILAILFFGGVWGFWGIFFAIPLATLVKAISNAWPMRAPSAMDLDESEEKQV